MAGHVDPGELDALFGALSTIFVLSPSAMALALNTMLGDKVLDGSMLSPGPILEYYLGSLHRCAVDITQGKISGDDFRSQARVEPPPALGPPSRLSALGTAPALC